MDYNEDMLLAKRNIAALAVGLNQFEVSRQEDIRRIANLENQVVMLTQRVQQLAVDVAVARATMFGRGPTQ